MIVRNEAALLPRFIASVEGLWDQFVAVDTGSTDGSQALLAAAGAEVIEIPWPDDFAKARNVSLDHARGDFVLVLDADEFPGPGFAAELRQLIADPTIGAAAINITSLQPDVHQRSSRLLRLFPCHPALRYRYRIHEDISGSVLPYLKQNGRRLGQLQTPVEHVGYTLGQLTDKNKQARDERLLGLAIADDPNDLYAYFKLMEQYRLWGNRRDPWRQHAQQCLKLLDSGQPIEPPPIAGALLDLIRIGLFGDAVEPGRQFLLARQKLAADDAWYWLALGNLQEQTGHRAAALEGYQAALAFADRQPARTLLETRSLMGLTRLSLTIGDFAAAREFTAAAAEISPDDPEVKLAHASVCVETPPAQEASCDPHLPQPSPIHKAAPRLSKQQDSETVSVITPTRNRERFLRHLEAIVRAQTYPDIEWLIHDDSPSPSAYFSALANEDKKIIYIHSPVPVSIGEKRNRMIESATGEIIVHFDDDDFYSARYIETMVARLRAGYDIAKLSGWFLYSGIYRALGYWDCTQTSGLHYIWSDRPADLAIFGPKEAANLKDNYLGFGFSYVYRKRVWAAGRFPDMNWDEDRTFIKQAITRFRLCHFADASGLCLHMLHRNNTSRCFPQYVLPTILLDRLFDPACHAMLQASWEQAGASLDPPSKNQI
jgi:glycosyltransferase involved in cell wall biosynthesis